MHELPQDSPNKLRQRILGNKKISRKSLKCFYLISMTLATIPKEMRFPASAGGSTCEVMDLLFYILTSARLCFLVIKMLDLQYLRK